MISAHVSSRAAAYARISDTISSTGWVGFDGTRFNELQLCGDRCMMTSGRTRRSGAIGHLAVGHLAARAVAYRTQFRTGNSAESADARSETNPSGHDYVGQRNRKRERRHVRNLTNATVTSEEARALQLEKTAFGCIWHARHVRHPARSRRRDALGKRPPPHSSPPRRMAVHVLLHLRRVDVASVRVVHVHLLLARPQGRLDFRARLRRVRCPCAHLRV